MPGLTPSSPPNASGTVRGLVSTVAQTFAGVKTFLARIVATLGITSGANRLDLRSDLGGGATDVCSVVGSTVADASVNGVSALWSARTGIGTGTEIEYLRLEKQSFIVGTSGNSINYLRIRGSGGSVWIGGSGQNLTFENDLGGVYLRIFSGGRIDQRGTDSTGSPGAATIDRPIGKSAIAAGASSVVITNNLVTAASHIVITPHARDATCKELIAVPALGSFTVSGTANATAALPFSWRVATILTA